MLTDYKFWYIKRDDNGFITEAAVRFYEGDYVQDNGETKYIRLRRLGVTDLTHLAKKIRDKGLGIPYLTEINKTESIFYTSEDFGQIKEDNELRAFLNKELAKDKTRIPVEAQQWQH